METSKVIDAAKKLIQQKKWDEAIPILIGVLDVKWDEPWILFMLGVCYHERGNDGIAYSLLSRAVEFKSDFFPPLLALAPILKSAGMHREQVAVLKECMRIDPENAAVWHNMSNAYLNNGTPAKAEKLARDCIRKFGPAGDTQVQLGLALLEQEKFGEGFDMMDKALISGHRKHRNFWSLGQTPIWEGQPGLNVVMYGEQGHGDELKYAGCINEMIKLCNQVIIDTSKPDMIQIYERSFPEAIVICTIDSKENPHHHELKIDAMIPSATLPSLFRRSSRAFPKHNGYLVASAAKRREMRRRLDEIGPGLKIGLAWRGGVKDTHSHARNVPLEELGPILKLDAHFVSVQYGPDAYGHKNIAEDRTGVKISHWQSAINDFDMLTALIDELDLVISVPQTAVHQRGGLGKECWVMTSSKPPWDFGTTRDNVIWYPKQTRQFRQKPGENWEPVIDEIARQLSKRISMKEVA